MYKNNIIKDFEKMRFSSNFEKNTSNNKMIFTISRMNYKKNEYTDKLFIYDKSEISRLKLSNKYSVCKFYQDNHIIYTTKPETVKKRTFTKIYIQGLNARKYTKEFNIPFEIATFYILNKDKLLLISNEKLNKDEEDFKYEIDRINFLSNGSGYTYNDISRAYIYDMTKNECKRITSENEIIASANVDIKTSNIYYTTLSLDDVYKPLTNLYSYNFEKEENITLYDKKDFEIIDAYSLGGNIIAIASDMKRYGINENPQFYKVENNSLTIYSENEYSLDNSVNSDVRYKTHSQVKQFKNAIYFLSTRFGKSSIYRLKDGKIELFFDKINVVDDFLFLGNQLIICGFDKQNMQEIYSFDLKFENGDVEVLDTNKKITDFSSKFEKHISNYKVDEFTFESNNDELTGYVVYPKDFDDSKKYPAILCIHGGPKTIYSSNFFYEMYCLSQNGYFVIYTNPHGSDNSDNKFADIRGKYGSIDYDDLMKFTDITLEKYTCIDREKLAVMGGSYGGFMTNYVVGNTDRFKTAITQRCISNWVSFYGTSDIGYYFATDQNGCEFEVDKLWDKSPLKNVDNIKTPLLILHSDEDHRCPLEQGVQLFTRLKVNGVKTKLVIYKGENHDLSRTGKVQSRVSRLEQIFSWLEETM